MSLRVLFISQWFPPEPYRLPMDIAQSLQSAGCEITVLTGIPNYPSGDVAPGYHAWKGGTETIEGVNVIRAPLFPSHDFSGIKRAANYLSFGSAAALRALSPARKFDVSLVFSSPITAAIPAAAARYLRGIPYVMMVQDFWPNVVYESGLLDGEAHPAARRILDSACLNIYRNAAHCFAITPGMRSDLIAMGVPESQVDTFWNWGPAEGKSAPTGATSLRQAIGANDQDLILAYSGNMGSTHGLETWVSAVTQLNESIDRTIHLAFIGDGVVRAQLEDQVRAAGKKRVHFLGRVDDETFLAYRNSADANVVSLQPSPVFDASMPSKIPDTLANGGLIIGSVRGDARSLILESGGIVAADNSVASIAAAITELSVLTPSEIEERKAIGRSLYEQRMSRAVGTRALVDALQAAVRAKR